jgi:hypothetical protein
VYCDVCNAATDQIQGYLVSAREFRELLKRGFGIDEVNIKMLSDCGMSREKAVGLLATQYTSSLSDWLLCPKCAAQAIPILHDIRNAETLSEAMDDHQSGEPRDGVYRDLHPATEVVIGNRADAKQGLIDLLLAHVGRIAKTSPDLTPFLSQYLCESRLLRFAPFVGEKMSLTLLDGQEHSLTFFEQPVAYTFCTLPVELGHAGEWFAQHHGGFLALLARLASVREFEIGKYSVMCHITYGCGEQTVWVQVAICPMTQDAPVSRAALPIELLSEKDPVVLEEHETIRLTAGGTMTAQDDIRSRWLKRRQDSPVNLKELRQGFAGTKFRDLIVHHIAKQKQVDRERGIQATLSVFPDSARPAVERFHRHWMDRIHESDLWRADTAIVFDELIAEAQKVLSEADGEFGDQDAFDLFNLVVLTFACAACEDPGVRKTAGILDRGLPWASLLSLLYPVSAGLYLYVRSGGEASPTVIAGYALANLGYLLFAAGLLFGSFRLFGLSKRSHVLAAAIAAWIVGTLLCNT